MLQNKGHMGLTPIFSSDSDKNFFYQDLVETNIMKEVFKSDRIKLKYDYKKFDFQKAVIKNLISLGIIKKKDFVEINNDLSRLHEILSDREKNLDEHELNGVTRKFYEFDDKLQMLYVNFLTNVISPIFPNKIFYQKNPTFRFSFPQNKDKFIKRYHSDIMLGHPPRELNIWINITDVFSTNSLRIMNLKKSLSLLKKCDMNFEIFAERVQYDELFQKELKKNSCSLEMSYGYFTIFDSRCFHCTQQNRTDRTRVSMDIRIIQDTDFELLKRKYIGTGRKRSKFVPGEYYARKKI